MKKNKSFTLIELLVVISVLAGFMAILVPNFMEIRKKARDMRRKSDLKGIQKALELYKQNQATAAYPNNLPDPCTAFTDASSTVYMQSVPQDPLTKCGVNQRRYYYLIGADTGTYTMYACLENSSDTESGGCPGNYAAITGEACSSGKCYQLKEP